MPHMPTVDFSTWQDNRSLAKEETVVVKLFFSVNPSAVTSVNTFWTTLSAWGLRRAASGARLQSSILSPLFPCFLSLLGNRRQGQGMSAASSGTEEPRLLTLATGRAVNPPLSPLHRKKKQKKKTSADCLWNWTHLALEEEKKTAFNHS